MVNPTMKMLDLSKVNVVTDWSALAANYDGVIIQATYGGNLTTGVQATFAPYWQAAKAHGLKRIAYHYLYPQYNRPEQEAANFLAHVTLEPGDGWAVDVEEPCPDPAAYSSAFMQIVEQGTGAPRNWYSYPAYIQQYGITAASVGNPHLWLASYRDTEPTPPPGWASISIWQHTSNATVAGIDGVVDEDYLYLTPEQYAALCKPQPQGVTVDPITTLALNRAKAANPAITPDPNSTGFKSYREWVRIWDANGRPSWLDPSPWLRNAAATATDEYIPLDNGAILHSTNKSGAWVTYLAEDKERSAIYAAMGWGKAA